ncbi:hypothetical protein [Pseudomonas palleroniana]|uniref:hypothetical protein n=1 Tax=Pseudomonas palleroniana TaxID=191390 RepID=UPI001FCFAB6D|nr:hypothetical protein [Pseudomonas palleroniana]UOP09066.1 hypothetical protein LDL65_18420 [Pseudomonas palleroniana]
MQKRIIALLTLSIIGLTNTANAYTWPADQLYEESLDAEIWSVSCPQGNGWQSQYRRVYIKNADGSRTYVNKGNGIVFRNQDGYEVTRDCYNYQIEGLKTDYEVATDTKTIACENPKAIGNVTKFRRYISYTTPKITTNLKTSFNIYELSDDCRTKEIEVKTEACQAGYTGQIVNSRTYDLYTDGRKANYSNWTTTQDTCSKNENQQFTRANCPSLAPNYQYNLGNTLGLYGRTVKQSGAASDWNLIVVVQNNCYYLKDTVTSTNEVACPVGQSGKIVRETHLKLKQYISWSQTDSSYIVEKENTCKPTGPVTVEIKPGTQTVSCDNYYGVQQGTYSGNVTKTGDNLTIFDPVSGSTNTTFQAKNEDTTSCVKEITATTKEIIEEECPAGFIGKITKYLVKAENASGTVYPYGITPILESNTCTAVSVSDEINAPSTEHLQDSVLSNLSFTTTSISKSDLIIDQLNKIDTSKLEGKAYIMNVSADNLSAGTFDSTKISNLVKTFKTKLGTQSTSVKLTSAPVTLDKYIGQDGLTQSRIAKEKLALSGMSIDKGTVTVKYVSLAKPTPAHYSFTVKVFE